MPATGRSPAFRVHEILRKTRRHPEARILLNDQPVAREELLAMYRMLVPNTNLEPLPRFTLYTLPRILLAAVVGGIVAGAWMGRGTRRKCGWISARRSSAAGWWARRCRCWGSSR